MIRSCFRWASKMGRHSVAFFLFSATALIFPSAATQSLPIVRRASLSREPTPVLRGNGNYDVTTGKVKDQVTLTANGANTAQADGADVDLLYGQGGKDWFLARSGIDRVLDRAVGEQILPS